MNTRKEMFYFLAFCTICVLYNFSHIHANKLESNSMLLEPQGDKITSNTLSTSKNDDYCMKTHQSCLQHNVHYEYIKALYARRSTTYQTRVCAYSNTTGLENFDNPCEIALKNCQIRRPLMMNKTLLEVSQAKGIFKGALAWMPQSKMEGLLNALSDLKGVIERNLVNFKKSPKNRLTVEYIETSLELLEKDWSLFREINTKFSKLL